MRFVVWVLVNAAALGLTARLFDDITVTGSDTGHRLLTLVAVGLIFGVISAVVKPLLKVLTLPLTILTLGLFLLVLNALMLLLTGKIAGALDIGFHVHGFWTALWGSIVISLALMVLDALLPDRDRNRERR